jgi:ribonuclease P protein component
MLAKKYRGLNASEISQLFQKEHRSHSNAFFRVLWKETDEAFPRFVVITTGKFHKSAVVRNRFRRALYDMVQQSFSRWTDGLRVAIVLKSPALQASRKELQESFHDLMKKSRLF